MLRKKVAHVGRACQIPSCAIGSEYFKFFSTALRFCFGAGILHRVTSSKFPFQANVATWGHSQATALSNYFQ